MPLFCLWLPQILLPSGLLCYFIGSNALGLVIMLMLKVGPIRSAHGLVGKTELLMPFIQNPNLLLGLGEHVKIARQELKELESGQAMAQALVSQGVMALEGGLGARSEGLVHIVAQDTAVERSHSVHTPTHVIVGGSKDVAQGGSKDMALKDANMELVEDEKRDPNDPEGVPPPVQDWTKNRRH